MKISAGRPRHRPDAGDANTLTTVRAENDMDTQEHLERPVPRRLPRGLLVYGVALLVGLAMVWVVFGRQSFVNESGDPYEFGAMGASLANGDGFAGFGSLIKRRAPLYPTMIGAVYWLVGERERAVWTIQAFMFAGICLFAYLIGRRLFNERTGLIAAAVCTFHPMLLRYVPSLHLEIQLTLLMAATLYLTIRFHERPSVRLALLTGVVGGLASLTKAVALPYLPLFAAGIVLATVRARRRGRQATTPWVPLVLMGLALVVTISPWTIRNYQRTGHLVPVSSGTSDAFLRGFIFSRTEFITLEKPPYTDAENESNAYFRALAAAEGTEWQKDDYETEQILNAEAKRRLKAEPLGVARKTVVGVFTFWYQLTSLKNSLLALVCALAVWFFACIGWRRASAQRRPTWLLFLPVLYLNAMLAVLLALGRYSVPVLPALVVVAAYGVDGLLDRRAARPSP